MYHLNVKLLRSFAVVAAEGSVTKAADLLNLTQPTVSGHIKDLEAELNCLLFYRTTRRLALSEKGQVLLPAVIRLLESADEVKSLGDSIQADSTANFRLGAAMYTQELELRGNLLDGFSSMHPDIHYQIDCRLQTNLVSDLLSGKLDAAILLGLSVPLEQIESGHNGEEEQSVISNESLIPDHLEKIVLGSRKLGLWIPCNHWLSKKASIDGDDLNDVNVVMLSAEHGGRIINPVQRFLKANRANLVCLNEGNAFAVRMYCAKNQVCGLGLDWFDSTDQLVFREVRGLNMPLELSLVLGEKANPAARSLFNYADENFHNG